MKRRALTDGRDRHATMRDEVVYGNVIARSTVSASCAGSRRRDARGGGTGARKREYTEGLRLGQPGAGA